MYQPDLSPYAFVQASHRVYAIGWLDRDHAFERSDCSMVMLEQDLLRALSRGTVNQMRGYHGCPFCGIESPTAPGVRFPLGAAELWIPSGTGDVFAAPDLIYHYVASHGYRPPSAFIRALAEVDMATWDPDATFQIHSSGEDI